MKIKIRPRVVMHKRTGHLKELTNSWFGQVIWMIDFDKIPKGAIAAWPYVIYDDDKRFKDYEVISEL